MIPIPGTIDPEVIERALNKLWRQTSDANLSMVKPGEERATLRARVANLMIYVAEESEVSEINEVLAELSARHPCRALLMVGAEQSADRDIEMSVASFCRPSARKTDRNLCCEQITLNARGRFVAELPSAAIPLLVPDLPAFLWWSDDLNTGGRVFAELAARADRVIIDSSRFADAGSQMQALAGFIRSEDEDRPAISDLNWARLTSWRALIAGCFDGTPHRAVLNQNISVRIEYAENRMEAEAVAPQALLIAGWLASRLDWSPAGNANTTVKFERVEHAAVKPGRLISVALTTQSAEPTTFEVRRSEDGNHLKTTVSQAAEIHEVRVSKVRHLSVAELVGGEMEILCRDRIYEEAVLKAGEL